MDEKKNKLEERKNNLELIEGKDKLQQELDEIMEDEKLIEKENSKISEDKDSYDAIVFLIVLLGAILLFVSFITHLVSSTKINDLNVSLSDIEVLYKVDDENNVYITGEYHARLYKQKVCFDLNVEVRNESKKNISFARVIDNNSKQKFDITNLKKGSTYSHILVDNVNEKTNFDIEIKNITFEE